MPLQPTPRPPRLSRLETLVALYASLTAVAVVWGALRGHPNIFVLEGRQPLTLPGLAASVAFGLAMVLLSRQATRRFQWARTLHHEFRHLLGPLSTTEIVAMAAASSIGEECLFRGAMVPHLGIWISSALFALPHIGPGAKFLPWTLSSLVVGFALGGLFLGFGDLGAPIAAHFTINLLNLRHISRHER